MSMKKSKTLNMKKLLGRTKRKKLNESDLTNNDSSTIELTNKSVNGVTEEIYSNGSVRYSYIEPDPQRAPQRGVLHILSDGRIMVSPEPKIIPNGLSLLLAVAKQMPPKRIEISDLGDYKGEAQIMLEALRTGDAAFFRNVGDLLKPRPAAENKKKSNAKVKDREEIFLLKCITKAAKKTMGLPTGEDILKFYRAGRYKTSHSPSHLRDALELRGFGWLMSIGRS